MLGKHSHTVFALTRVPLSLPPRPFSLHNISPSFTSTVATFLMGFAVLRVISISQQYPGVAGKIRPSLFAFLPPCLKILPVLKKMHSRFSYTLFLSLFLSPRLFPSFLLLSAAAPPISPPLCLSPAASDNIPEGMWPRLAQNNITQHQSEARWWWWWCWEGSS